LAVQIQQASPRIAIKLARLVIDSTHCLASQHIKGEQSTVFDLLSYAGDVRGYSHPLAPDIPSDSVLTQRFHLHIPQLIPEGFDISPLPSKISSFVIQALQTIELSWIQNRKKVWHQWLLFCSKAGLVSNPFLVELQQTETKLVIRSFLSLYRVAEWSTAGAILGQRKSPVV
jgi:hypothetical protein